MYFPVELIFYLVSVINKIYLIRNGQRIVHGGGTDDPSHPITSVKELLDLSS